MRLWRGPEIKGAPNATDDTGYKRNDTPFPTTCNPFGYIHNLAQFFLDAGYSPRELWGLGYQGDQCDLLTSPTNRSGFAHSTEANVPDLRAFVHAVLEYTGAERVDIVAHSLGVTLTREWMRQDRAFHRVRALVAIDGPNHGIISCSPSPLNYFQLPSLGGFTPDSAICREYGSDHTPLLQALNRGREARGPTRYLVLLNTDVDFVYISAQDGFFPAVPAEDRDGSRPVPHYALGFIRPIPRRAVAGRGLRSRGREERLRRRMAPSFSGRGARGIRRSRPGAAPAISAGNPSQAERCRNGIGVSDGAADAFEGSESDTDGSRDRARGTWTDARCVCRHNAAARRALQGHQGPALHD
jgi:pimeloyl-ACP methyl ester carboxylesterase